MAQTVEEVVVPVLAVVVVHAASWCSCGFVDHEVATFVNSVLPMLVGVRLPVQFFVVGFASVAEMNGQQVSIGLLLQLLLLGLVVWVRLTCSPATDRIRSARHAQIHH